MTPSYKRLVFSSVIGMWLFHGTSAWSWYEPHHRWVFSDALDYMEGSGDPFLRFIAEYLQWAPGYNKLRPEVPHDDWDDPRCVDPNGYSAACALRDEAANTDWYEDMGVKVDPVGLLGECLFGFELRSITACELWPIFIAFGFVVPILPARGIPVMGTVAIYEERAVTRLNHYLGGFYEDDQVPRNWNSTCLSPDTREAKENLGNSFKDLPSESCGPAREGDCKWENSDTLQLHLLGQLSGLGLLSIEPGQASRYNDLTCHHHSLAAGMNPVTARYFPVDSMAEYWTTHWLPGNDLVRLGPGLHASIDALNPHHSYLYTGRGHDQFEKWASPLAAASFGCRPDHFEQLPPAVQAELFSNCVGLRGFFAEFFSPARIREFLQWPEFNEDPLKPTENLVADVSMRAATWDFRAGQPDRENATFGRAIVWRAEEKDLDWLSSDDGANWSSAAVMGNNLAVAMTTRTLEREFQRYLEPWEQSGYCGELRVRDLDAWRRTVPGPRVGAALPSLETGGYYINIFSDGMETNHPYYNDAAAVNSSLEFGVPHTGLREVDIVTNKIMLTFSPRCDWFGPGTEDDFVRIWLASVDEATERVGEYEVWQDFHQPSEIAGGTITIEKPAGKRLAYIKIELVQGGGSAMAVGEGGTILRFDGSTWTAMESGVATDLLGVWGSSSTDVFAVGGLRQVLHFDGFSWNPMEVPVWTYLGGIWGASGEDVYAVGNLNRVIVHYDGLEWTLVPGRPPRMGALLGVWGSSGTDVFAVGEHGVIEHYDGSTWEGMTSGVLLENLTGISGSSSSDVFAVGNRGTILHYNGSTWSSIGAGISADLRGVWVDATGGEVYVVGEGGTVLHGEGHPGEERVWSGMNSGTTADLFAVAGQSASDVFAVGSGGTVLHYDGRSWSAMDSGVSDSLYGVWRSSIPGCTPVRKFGLKVDRIEAEVEQTNRPPLSVELLEISAELLDWIRNLASGETLKGLDWIFDCRPGLPCDDRVGPVVAGAVREALDSGGLLENEQVFELVYDAVSNHVPDPAVCPALAAYAVVTMAMAARPGQSITESGLVDVALAWSQMKQGTLGGMLLNATGTVQRQVAIDFLHPRSGSRAAEHLEDGTGLPAVFGRDMKGYPGFREATAAELSSAEGMQSYFRAKQRYRDSYQFERLLAIGRENDEGLRRILDTDASGNPAAQEKIDELKSQLALAKDLLERMADTDGDGVSNRDDLCPSECARGMDADLDGCIDRPSGLEEEVGKTSMFWVPGMVLSWKAQRANEMERRGKPKAAAGLLRAFERLVRDFVRIGWIDARDGERLRQYAINARDAALGKLGRLDCPGGEGGGRRIAPRNPGNGARGAHDHGAGNGSGNNDHRGGSGRHVGHGQGGG